MKTLITMLTVVLTLGAGGVANAQDNGWFDDNDYNTNGYQNQGWFEDNETYGYAEDEGWNWFEDDYGAYDQQYGETYGYDEDWDWGFDDYGYYDRNYEWETNETWFGDWYGDSDEWF